MTRKARLSRGRRKGGAPLLLVISFVLLAGVAAFDHNPPAFYGALLVGAALALSVLGRPSRRRRTR